MLHDDAEQNLPFVASRVVLQRRCQTPSGVLVVVVVPAAAPRAAPAAERSAKPLPPKLPPGLGDRGDAVEARDLRDEREPAAVNFRPSALNCGSKKKKTEKSKKKNQKKNKKIK